MSKLLVLCAVFVCACTVYADQQSDVQPTTEDPYSSMMMKMMMPKMMNPKMMNPKMMNPKTPKTPKTPKSPTTPHTPKAAHSTAAKHSTGDKKDVHASSTGVHAPAAPKKPATPVSAPAPTQNFPGGWPLPTYPTERLRRPLPEPITEDPYGGMSMMMGKMMMGKGMGNMGSSKNMGSMTGSNGKGSNGKQNDNGAGPKTGGKSTDKGTTMTASAGSCATFADANYLCANAACTSKVSAGSAQPNYQCAEFVSRTLASTGKIPNLTSGSPQSSFGSYNYNGKTYDLLWTSHKAGGPLGLEDFLIAAGWKSGGSVKDCSVAFVNGADGAWGHVAVGVGTNLLDAHNNARLHVATSYYTVNAIYNQ